MKNVEIINLLTNSRRPTRLASGLASAAVILSLAACGAGTTLESIQDDLANGEDVDLTISTNDDGSVVIGVNNGDDTAGDGPEAGAVGAVYAMTNADTNNSIVAYGRQQDGTLELIGSENTGGAGTGTENVASGPAQNTIDPLASNFSVIMSADNNYVFAVNAGSDEVSSLGVNSDYSLTSISTVASGGSDPVSLAANASTVFVANTNEGVGSIQMLSIGADGSLSPSGQSVVVGGRPTAIALTEDGTSLVVALVDTDRLELFSVSEGSLNLTDIFDYRVPEGRSLANPFGLTTYAVDGNQFVAIAEARLDPLQTSSLSVFSVSGGSLTQTSNDIRADLDGDDDSGAITSCWVLASPDNGQLYTVNTNANSLTEFAVDTQGVATTSSVFSESAADFTEIGLTDAVLIDEVIYVVAAAEGSVISYSVGDSSSSFAFDEIDRDIDLAAAGGNQGITGF